MITRSLAAVTLGLGVLCLTTGGIGGPSLETSGSFAIAGSVLIGAALIALAIDGRKQE